MRRAKPRLDDGAKPSPDDEADTSPGGGSVTSGSDFLQLDIGAAPRGGRAAWLAARIREAIGDGRLPVGSRLPATRTLAAELHVSRGLVTEAYQRLVEDGYVAGRGRGGTVVVARPLAVPDVATAPNGRTASGVRTAPNGRTAPGGALDSDDGAARVVVGPNGGPVRDGAARLDGRRTSAPGPSRVFTPEPGMDVFDLLRAAPARVDLTPGVPDLAVFPRAAWLRAERSVLAGLVPSDLGYGDPHGAPALRVAVSRWLARTRGIRVDPERVIIVAGVAQALALLAQVLRAHGIGTVAVEEPCSLGVRQHLRNGHLATPPVRVDDRGLCVDELRAGGHPVVMVTPAHQFPTGVVLDGERRRALRVWAEEGGLVVEDDYDAEHRYDRPPVPALRASLPEHVCYLGSISKLLAPALRVGWLLAPRRYHDEFVAAKRNADLGTAMIPQLVLAHLMESGELERHLRLLRRRHVRRRDAMIAALRSHLPDAVVHGAAAGLHLMVTFGGPSAVADVEFAEAALARGVKVQPLSWHCQRAYSPGLVLGYAARSPHDIRDAIATLADVRAGLRRRPGSPAGP